MKQLPKNFINNFKYQPPVYSIKNLNFKSFVDKAKIVYVENSTTTLELRELQYKYQESDFYPIVLIKKNTNITKQLLEKKIQEAKKSIKKEFFLNRLYCVALEEIKSKTQSSIFDFIVTNLSICPYCSQNTLFLTDDYGIKSNIEVKLLFSCVSCNEVIIEKALNIQKQFYFDMVYLYNEKIKEMLDLYINNYPKNIYLINKIQNEQEKNTLKTSWI